MARKLSFDFKLTARTAPELYEAVNNVVTRAASEGVKFRRRKVGVEALVNALLIDFLDRDEDGRLALLRTNIPRFERMLESDPDALPPVKAGGHWLPGSVRDQASLDDAPRKPPHVNETKVDPDRKPGKRRGAG